MGYVPYCVPLPPFLMPVAKTYMIEVLRDRYKINENSPIQIQLRKRQMVIEKVSCSVLRCIKDQVCMKDTLLFTKFLSCFQSLFL